ncbi:hypothetical protein [Pricia sp.]|uniref:hypothetical protein n=1 Tax=Pricia sp. TaxID=2268138 RepID=UPI0035948F1D
MKSFFKHSVSLFFLASFLLLRVVNVHEFSHIFSDSDAQHCEPCVLIAHGHQGTPLDMGTVQTDFSLQGPFDGAQVTVATLYTAPYQKTLHSDYFHNKPPPSYSLG